MSTVRTFNIACSELPDEQTARELEAAGFRQVLRWTFGIGVETFTTEEAKIIAAKRGGAPFTPIDPPTAIAYANHPARVRCSGCNREGTLRDLLVGTVDEQGVFVPTLDENKWARCKHCDRIDVSFEPTDEAKR